MRTQKTKLNPFKQPVTFREFVLGKWRTVSLRPGQRVVFSRFRRDEEGWSRESVEFRREGDMITWIVAVDSRDCDGRQRDYTEAQCPVSDLKARQAWLGRTRHGRIQGYSTRGKAPRWVTTDHEYRDYTAEAAGY